MRLFYRVGDAVGHLSPALRGWLWVYLGCLGLLVLLLSLFVRDDPFWIAPFLAGLCVLVAGGAYLWAAHDLPTDYSRFAFAVAFLLIQLAVCTVILLALVWRPDLLWEPPAPPP